VYEALVMDNRSYAAVARETGQAWRTFVDLVAAVVVRTEGCVNYDELMSKMRAEARERGEMPERESKAGTRAVALTKDKEGIRYTTVEETLTARAMFRETW
jgi:L-2-hydroxyglutarate oxidase LhgO